MKLRDQGVNARFQNFKPKPEEERALAEDHPAVLNGRTRYLATVKSPVDVDKVLVSGENNSKIGSRVTKGAWKGMPIFTLTLEERATCPRSCHHWRTCYGNNMHWSRRHAHGLELEQKLLSELLVHAGKYPHGFVVRLHVLGDFYSVEYCLFWAMMLRLLPMLRIWGYTAHGKGSPIGDLIEAMNTDFPDRFFVRRSVAVGPEEAEGFVSVTVDEIPPSHRIGSTQICPAQLYDGDEAKADNCGSCGLCWSPEMTETPIGFIRHGSPQFRKSAKEGA